VSQLRGGLSNDARKWAAYYIKLPAAGGELGTRPMTFETDA
jgi:hypothetical protein